MKQGKAALPIAVALALCGNIATAKAASTEEQLDQLTKQIKTLEENIRQLKKDQETTAQAAKQAKPAAEGAPMPANVPPGFLGIPGTDTAIRLGGAVMLEGMFDVGQKGPEGSIAPGVAVNSPNAASKNPYRKGHTSFTAKYSQLEFESRSNLKEGDILRTFVSMDFAGTTATNPLVFTSTNAYIPRLREAYLTYGNWLVGQTAPIFSDPYSITEPLDAGLHHDGMNLNRMPQITYTQPVNPKLKVAGSLVGPASSYTTWNNVQESNYDTGAGGARAMASFPDINVAATYEDTWGHVKAQGMGRQIRSDDAVKNTTVWGWGLGLTGHFNVPLGGKDMLGGTSRLSYGVNYGEGIANYITDLGYQGAVMDNRDNLHAIGALGWYGGYTHVWDNNWRSSARYSESLSDSSQYLNAAAAAAWNTRLDLFGINTVYQINPKWKAGLEWEWQYRQVQDGSDGHSSRWVTFTKLSF